MKLIYSLILCFAPLSFFANTPVPENTKAADILHQTSQDLKLGFNFLKSDQPEQASYYFSNIIHASRNQSFPHKYTILFTAAYGWAVALDQLDQMDEFYKFVGKSFCDLAFLGMNEPNFDVSSFYQEIMDLLADDDRDDFIEKLIDINEEDFANLFSKAKNSFIKRLLELDAFEDEDDDC
jgi:hypothetical protein